MTSQVNGISFNKIGKGRCSKCGKEVIVWGDLKDELCMKCDEDER